MAKRYTRLEDLNVERTPPKVIVAGICLVTLCAVIIVAAIFGPTPSSNSAGDAREARIREQFSPWDGSHYNLESFVKREMNDPDSYEHIETRFNDEGDYLRVKTKFRGNNTFGGLVRQVAIARVGLDGQVLEMEYFGPPQ